MFIKLFIQDKVKLDLTIFQKELKLLLLTVKTLPLKYHTEFYKLNQGGGHASGRPAFTEGSPNPISPPRTPESAGRPG